MTRTQLISLLHVAESALWSAATVSPDALSAHQQIARGLRAVEAADNCPQCGNPLVQPEVGRPKRYCGDGCRKAAYKARRTS
jgi:hypothetical protein